MHDRGKIDSRLSLVAATVQLRLSDWRDLKVGAELRCVALPQTTVAFSSSFLDRSNPVYESVQLLGDCSIKCRACVVFGDAGTGCLDPFRLCLSRVPWRHGKQWRLRFLARQSVQLRCRFLLAPDRKVQWDSRRYRRNRSNV